MHNFLNKKLNNHAPGIVPCQDLMKIGLDHLSHHVYNCGFLSQSFILRYATLRHGNRIILNEIVYTVQIRAMARLGSWTAGCVIYFLWPFHLVPVTGRQHKIKWCFIYGKSKFWVQNDTIVGKICNYRVPAEVVSTAWSCLGKNNKIIGMCQYKNQLFQEIGTAHCAYLSI